MVRALSFLMAQQLAGGAMHPSETLYQQPDRQTFCNRHVERAGLDFVLLGCLDQLISQNERINDKPSLPMQ